MDKGIDGQMHSLRDLCRKWWINRRRKDEMDIKVWGEGKFTGLFKPSLYNVLKILSFTLNVYACLVQHAITDESTTFLTYTSINYRHKHHHHFLVSSILLLSWTAHRLKTLNPGASWCKTCFGSWSNLTNLKPCNKQQVHVNEALTVWRMDRDLWYFCTNKT